jgi:circadian clock protein KaiC
LLYPLRKTNSVRKDVYPIWVNLLAADILCYYMESFLFDSDTQDTAGPQLPKSPTGIQGLDEVTAGGLPKGRPTLLAGRAGSGKTLLAMQFLVNGATLYNEPGVFMSFEETSGDLEKNVASLGFDLKTLEAEKKIVLDHVSIERRDVIETGEYDLEALFIRLNESIDSIGAQRVVLDTIESIFSGLQNTAILRAELRRLFQFLKDKGVTAIITGEAGEGRAFTRHGLEEYVSDCVVFLDHRVTEQISTRRLRVVKYRGSLHGTNEYPFLIDRRGIWVLPITSLGLTHIVSSEGIPTGIPRLDTMLGGQGYYRGSSVLVTGTPGTGKTSVSASFANATCERGERCLYFAFEESPSQIIRNMRSIGIDLEPWVKSGQLLIYANRPNRYGLEMHLAVILKLVQEFKPDAVIVDPVSNLIAAGSDLDANAMLTRLIDYLKLDNVTTLFTSLTPTTGDLRNTEVGISSLMDTWVLLRDIETNGERNRGIYVLKSRGMAHSNQIREFKLSSKGIDLQDVYLGPAGVLTGTARYVQEVKEKAEALSRKEEIQTQRRRLEAERKTMEAQIAALQEQFSIRENEIARLEKQESLKEDEIALDRQELARRRRADTPS